MGRLKMNSREQKIKDIIGLLTGEKKLSDLNPSLELFYDTDGEKIINRKVNGKEVDEQGFLDAASVNAVPGTLMFIKTHGRKYPMKEVYI